MVEQDSKNRDYVGVARLPEYRTILGNGKYQEASVT